MYTRALTPFAVLCAGALGLFLTTLPLSPEQTSTLLARAYSERDQGNYAHSIHLLKKALRHNGPSTQLYLDLGHTYRYWYKFPPSEKAFLHAIALSPTNPWPHTDLGKLYRNMGRFDDAERAFRKSIELDPTMAEAYSYGLGYLYMQQERLDEAAAMFAKAYELDPTSDTALTGLGDVARSKGELAKAKAYYDQALALRPESEARYSLAYWHTDQDQYVEARDVLLSYLEINNERAEVYHLLGVVYEALGEQKKADESFLKAAVLNPDRADFQVK